MPRMTPYYKSVVGLLLALAFVVLCARRAIALFGLVVPGGFVYALNQVNGGANQIYGFRIDPVTGTLTPLLGFPVPSGGTGGAGSFSEHLAYRNGLLFVVNEGSASLSVFNVGPASGVLTATPFSPIALSGDLACVAADPTDAPVVVGGSAGLASIHIVPLTATVAPGSPFATPGAFPFSCAFSRDGNYVYTGGNVGSTVAGFSVTPTTGGLTALPGSPFDTGAGNPVGYATDDVGRFYTSNFGSGIRVFTLPGGILTPVAGNPFPSGLSGGVQGILQSFGFYVVADRSANQVGVYHISGGGAATTVTPVAGISPIASGGSFTDAVTLAASEAFLVAANGLSRNLSVFSVSSGALLAVQPVNTIGSTGLITGLTSAPRRIAPVAGDFDGDTLSDFTFFRPSTGTWNIQKSGPTFPPLVTVSWGLSTDVPVPGDFDGDGKIDPTIYRPSTGLWAILYSRSNYTTSMMFSWGLSTDVPLAADYDGDGKADPAIYRPSTGLWAILKSSTNYTTSMTVSWGLSTDVPVPADYDGDGNADLAIYRPSTGLWAILKSSTGYTSSMYVSWGLSTDVPVPGDFDGDGKADPAIFRPSTGLWAALKSSTNYTSSFLVSWGLSTDIPVPSDYDGDRKIDPTVFRPSTGNWHVLKSITNYTTSFTLNWGSSTDTPINKRP